MIPGRRSRRARWLALAWISAALALAACSGGRERLRCEEPGEYAASRSAPPVRVPDELSVPNEAGALRVPQPRADAEDEDDAEDDVCLERPPDYFDDGAASDG